MCTGRVRRGSMSTKYRNFIYTKEITEEVFNNLDSYNKDLRPYGFYCKNKNNDIKICNLKNNKYLYVKLNQTIGIRKKSQDYEVCVLRDKISFNVPNNMGRLVKQFNGDQAFLYLAVYSFIESYMVWYLENCGIGVGLLDNFKTIIEQYKKENNVSNLRKSNLDTIKIEKDISNNVRHLFYSVNDEDMRKCLSNFKIFISENISIKNQKINKLIDDSPLLKQWDNCEKSDLSIYGNYLIKATKEDSSSISTLYSYSKSRRDWENFILRLTGEQMNLLKSIDFKHDVLIKGGAGTGKTLVIIKLLLQNLHKDICLLTHSKTLQKYDYYISKLSLQDEKEIKNEKVIRTVDSFLIEKLSTLFSCILINNDDIKQIYIASDVNVTNLTPRQIDEIPTLIWQNLLTEEEYCNGDYSNLNGGNKRKRILVWEFCQKLQHYMEANKKYIYKYLIFKVIIENLVIPEELKIDYLIIDEIQDLDLARLILIKKFVRYAAICSGDKNQTLYMKDLNWKRAGYSFQGNTKTLHSNFRNTYQINELANMYLDKCKIQDIENRTIAFRNGVIPSMEKYQNIGECYEKVVRYVSICIKDYGIDPSNICIATSSLEKDLPILKMNIKEQLHIFLQDITDEDFDFFNIDSIQISTLNSVKGLEYSVMILILDDRLQTQSLNRPNVIYTALTRANDMLKIFINTSDIQRTSKEDFQLSEFVKCYDEYIIRMKNELNL